MSLIPITPTMQAGVALREILRRLLTTVEENKTGVIADTNPDALHDLRVAIRRARSILSQFKKLFEPTQFEALRDDLSWLGKVTGPTRDLHVYLQNLMGYQQLLPTNVGQSLEPLQAFLQHQAQQEHHALVQNLTSMRFKELIDRWHVFLDASSSAGKSSKSIKSLADKRIWRMYSGVLNQGAAITPDSPDSEMHALRIAGKKLRYLLEFFTPLYPANDIARLIAALKRLQDNLGEFQDLTVQIEAQQYYAEMLARDAPLTTETQHAMDQLVVLLRSNQADCRAEFATLYSGFINDKNCRLFERLFRSS